MEDRIEQAVRHIELGNKVAAMSLLAQVLKDEPENDEAWAWMAEVVDDPQKKEMCLEKALRINPANQEALEALSKINGEEHLSEEPDEPFEPEPVQGETSPFEDMVDAEFRTPLFIDDDGEVLEEPEPLVQPLPEEEGLELVSPAAASTAAISHRRPRSRMNLNQKEKRILTWLIVLTVLVVFVTWGYIIYTTIWGV
ncbi:MAG: hypothetical protein EHM41_12130 [Chloroflexi bacterium]|nr:MAG: hypothetical protein EHM41_12130 [Chloroflexota bacterium]